MTRNFKTFKPQRRVNGHSGYRGKRFPWRSKYPKAIAFIYQHAMAQLTYLGIPETDLVDRRSFDKINWSAIVEDISKVYSFDKIYKSYTGNSLTVNHVYKRIWNMYCAYRHEGRGAGTPCFSNEHPCNDERIQAVMSEVLKKHRTKFNKIARQGL